MKIITIKSEAIEQFKASWPCHGLPDDVDLIVAAFAPIHKIVAAFAPNGDLVDYELSDAQGNVLPDAGENLDIDGAALSALFDIAKEHAVENPIIPGTISSGYTLNSYPESV